MDLSREDILKLIAFRLPLSLKVVRRLAEGLEGDLSALLVGVRKRHGLITGVVEGGDPLLDSPPL